MTPDEIDERLRLDNPTTTDDSGERHGPGSPVYEAMISRWAREMESQQRAEQRATACAALADKWAALPSWIRGPFGGKYDAAIRLLNANDDETAADLIRYADAPALYSPEQSAVFELVRAELLAALSGIPPVS